ncbi:hypothetical protein C8R43DRAFT_959858 [Mycena crocata]|nr:hypothetical protein C8R43DRAFT_959858 [Mycena crocata]
MGSNLAPKLVVWTCSLCFTPRNARALERIHRVKMHIQALHPPTEQGGHRQCTYHRQRKPILPAVWCIADTSTTSHQLVLVVPSTKASRYKNWNDRDFPTGLNGTTQKHVQSSTLSIVGAHPAACGAADDPPPTRCKRHGRGTLPDNCCGSSATRQSSTASYILAINFVLRRISNMDAASSHHNSAPKPEAATRDDAVYTIYLRRWAVDGGDATTKHAREKKSALAAPWRASSARSEDIAPARVAHPALRPARAERPPLLFGGGDKAKNRPVDVSSRRYGA